MKKFIVIMLMGCFGGWLSAQSVHYYDFAVRTEAYTPVPDEELNLLGGKKFETIDNGMGISYLLLSGDTAYSSLRSCGMVNIPANPIGFEFPYAGKKFTHFHLYSNGALILGDSESFPIVTTGAFTADTCPDLNYAIYSFFKQINMLKGESSDEPHTSIGYRMSETVSGKVLTVQFSNVVVSGSMNESDTVNFQMKLYEKDGRIEFQYGAFTHHAKYGSSLLVGLRETAKNDFITNKLIVSETGWSNPVVCDTLTKRNSNPSSWSLDFNSAFYPETGLTYVFSRPEPCTAPSAPTSLEISSVSSDRVEGRFETEAEAVAVVAVPFQENGAVPVLEDMEEYEDGTIIDAVSGAVFKGIFEKEEGKFLLEDLQPSLSYSLYVYGCNRKCTGGPLYSVDAKMESFQTLYAAPEIISVTPDTSSVSFQFLTEENTDLLVAFSSKKIEDEIVVSGKVKEGQQLLPGLTVFHKGESGDVRLEQLLSNTPYYVYAWTFKETAEDTVYSTLYAGIDLRTVGTLPCNWIFDTEKVGELPAGWKNAGSVLFAVSKDGGDFTGAGAVMSLGADLSGKKVDTALVETPYVHLNTGKHRFNFGISFTSQGFAGLSGYKVVAGDTVLVQVSSDGGDWETIYSVNPSTYTVTSKDFIDYECPFYNLNAGNARFRIVAYSAHKFKVRFQEIRTEYAGDCDSPAEVVLIDGSLSANQAEIGWKMREDATAESWRVSYLAAEETEWSAMIVSDTLTALLDGLQSGTVYRARVQSVCGNGSVSQWTEMGEPFTTAYAVPFQADFNGWHEVAPERFGMGTMKFPQEGESTAVVTGYSSAWKLVPDPRPETKADTCLASEFQLNAWYFLPVVSIERSASLDFTLSVLKDGKLPDQTVDPENYRFLVVASVDSGKTVSVDGILAAWGKGTDNSLKTLDSTPVHIDLSALSGKTVRLAFMMEGDGLNSGIACYIDDVEVLYHCPDPENLRAVSGETDVLLSWDAVDSAQSWVYRIRKTDDEEGEYRTGEVYAPQVSIDKLEPSVRYEYGVAALCARDEESAYSIGYFTTLTPYECPGVSEIRAGMGKRSITVSWKGEALSYDVRYRKKGEEIWAYESTANLSVELKNLEPDGTEYEYGVRSICSAAEGDTSVWSATYVSQTSYITCFAPEDLQIAATDTAISVTFTYEADQSELELVSAVDTIRYVVVDGMVIGGLEPETDYTARIRSICAVGDTSEWSGPFPFKTSALVNCLTPTDLTVVTDPVSLSAVLSWTAAGEESAWNLQYREKESTEWIVKESLAEKNLKIADLKSEIEYIWQVQARCAETRFSAWSETDVFVIGKVSNRLDVNGNITVSARNGVISIANPGNLPITQIEIYDLKGSKIMASNAVSGSEISLYSPVRTSLVLVRLILSNGEAGVYKVYVD